MTEDNASEDATAADDHTHNDNHTQVKKCCSGLCVDLLRKFEDDLGFTYELVRAEDPKWGTFEVVIHCEIMQQVIFAGREVEWSDGCLGQQEHRYGALCSEGRLAILDMNN